MKYTIEKSIEILEATPKTLKSLLGHLSDNWTHQNEGPETWSPSDVVGHLIHGEKTDWIPRTKIILRNGDKHFEPFDRFSMFSDSAGKTMPQLLDKFEKLRAQNIEELQSLNILESDLDRIGIHPEFGEVTLINLLSTWTVHDINTKS